MELHLLPDRYGNTDTIGYQYLSIRDSIQEVVVCYLGERIGHPTEPGVNVADSYLDSLMGEFHAGLS